MSSTSNQNQYGLFDAVFVEILEPTLFRAPSVLVRLATTCRAGRNLTQPSDLVKLITGKSSERLGAVEVEIEEELRWKDYDPNVRMHSLHDGFQRLPMKEANWGTDEEAALIASMINPGPDQGWFPRDKLDLSRESHRVFMRYLEASAEVEARNEAKLNNAFTEGLLAFGQMTTGRLP